MSAGCCMSAGCSSAVIWTGSWCFCSSTVRETALIEEPHLQGSGLELAEQTGVKVNGQTPSFTFFRLM
jgi:hypothetical protein